jgi:hypothetical protein
MTLNDFFERISLEAAKSFPDLVGLVICAQGGEGDETAITSFTNLEPEDALDLAIDAFSSETDETVLGAESDPDWDGRLH